MCITGYYKTQYLHLATFQLERYLFNRERLAVNILYILYLYSFSNVLRSAGRSADGAWRPVPPPPKDLSPPLPPPRRPILPPPQEAYHPLPSPLPPPWRPNLPRRPTISPSSYILSGLAQSGLHNNGGGEGRRWGEGWGDGILLNI